MSDLDFSIVQGRDESQVGQIVADRRDAPTIEQTADRSALFRPNQARIRVQTKRQIQAANSSSESAAFGADVDEKGNGAMGIVWWMGGTLAVVAAAFWATRRRSSNATTDASDAAHAAARQTFATRREWLEARFFTLASCSGKPRGLAWVDCDFERDVAWARDRETKQLLALVGLTVRFEAIPGGGMENNPNVGNLRAATAVFRFVESDWQTDGRTLFNLSPAQALEHFQHELEVV